ncbi:MAG TPA: carboxymuconolactone decarboxylase family protein, partial [Candidatus Limnocylindrales bacterium]
MDRDDERLARAHETPIVGSLPEAPGIRVAMLLTPGLGVHLRGLADELLVNQYPGATIDRVDRELIATAVSAANDCFFCMDSHGAHAAALMDREGGDVRLQVIDVVKTGGS